MPRSMRLLIVIAVMALVGVSALAWMARRYASIAPERSVQDLAPALPVPAPSPAPEPPAVESRPAAEAQPSPAGTVAPATSAASKDVDAFIAVRRPLRELVDGDPKGFRQLREQGEHPPQAGEVFNANFVLLSNFRIRRQEKLRETGLPLDRYVAIRSAYHAWKAGQAALAPDLAAAFSRRSAELAEVELGDGEYLDEQMKQ